MHACACVKVCPSESTMVDAVVASVLLPAVWVDVPPRPGDVELDIDAILRWGNTIECDEGGANRGTVRACAESSNCRSTAS
jgi:hypothetical protein